MPSPPRLLVTGATGTVGSRVLSELRNRTGVSVLTTTRHTSDASEQRPFFDLSAPARSAETLRDVDAAFLLLPPGLPDAASRFREMLDVVPDDSLPHLVFMSVQGADTRGFLPHAKIEVVIRKRFEEVARQRFTFLRPAYFMQNLEAAFGRDLRERHALVAPAGDANFVWVDAADIARAAVAVMTDTEPHEGHAYTITGTDVANFEKAAQLIAEAAGTPVTYESPNPVSYYGKLRSGGLDRGKAVAQTGIHFVERFTADATVSGDYTALTGKEPVTLAAWLQTVDLLSAKSGNTAD
jgi:uncharacterized protein YbjT (DUF2867 family)